MKPWKSLIIVAGAVLLTGGYRSAGPGVVGAVLLADEPPSPPSQEQAEVQTRGPVNEAFAEPVNLQIQGGLVVPKQPPADIVEEPPADKPEGDNIVWVPGYWAWDGDRNDFLWVSGCWRAAPPNTFWVPGYWAEVPAAQGTSRGWQVSVGGIVNVQVGGGPAAEGVEWEWVSGYWAPAGSEEVEYLPAPPAPEEIDPAGAAPSPDDVWVPGCWYWQDGKYAMRHGYWLGCHEGWVWVPTHYIWTPRGYIFVAGRWDYSLDRRGVLFAPVWIPPADYRRGGFRYSPSIVIDLGLLTANLFTFPRYCHYYFGDYYDGSYAHMGIHPWFDADRHHRWYDPILQYDRWRHVKSDPKWEDSLRKDYDRRSADKDLRPPHTYKELEAKLPKATAEQRATMAFAKPLTAMAADKTAPLKFQQINADTRQKLTTQAVAEQKFREERGKRESVAATGGKTTGPPPTVITPPAGTKPPAVEPKPLVEPKPAVVEPKPPIAGPKPPVVEPKPPAENIPALVPPRDVRTKEPERVKITPPPIAAPAPVEKGTPPPPGEELKHKEGK